MEGKAGTLARSSHFVMVLVFRDTQLACEVPGAGPTPVDRSRRNPYPESVMDIPPIKPERMAQLEDYARRHGQDTAAALDDVLADYFAWEQQDSQASVEAIRRGNEDVMAGRTKPAAEVHQSLRRKYGFPG